MLLSVVERMPWWEIALIAVGGTFIGLLFGALIGWLNTK